MIIDMTTVFPRDDSRMPDKENHMIAYASNSLRTYSSSAAGRAD